MLLIVGTIRLPADRLDAARPAMGRMMQASRAEDGCIAYAYAEDIVDRGLIHVTEQWRDQAALDAHFAAPHLADWRASWGHLGFTDRDLMLYEVGTTRRT